MLLESGECNIHPKVDVAFPPNSSNVLPFFNWKETQSVAPLSRGYGEVGGVQECFDAMCRFKISHCWAENVDYDLYWLTNYIGLQTSPIAIATL